MTPPSADAPARPPAIDFRTAPECYRHWRLAIEPPIAILSMDVDEGAGLSSDYELKLNSYDLGVDIELNDAVQRLRFAHPEVGAVLLTSAKARVFCAGANIRMLGAADHAAKVNFCKFTNETRCAIEQAGAESRQHYIAVINGPASGGGYELALACEHILLVDDGSTAVSLPELPMLAVLPGTGGLTRLVDKRKVRRDLADLFCTAAEGVRGRRALDWGLVDELAPPSRLMERARARAAACALTSDRPRGAAGIALTPLERTIAEDRLVYPHLAVAIEADRSVATFTLSGPDGPPPDTAAAIREAGAAFWPLALARALDDAILHLRTNRPDIGTWLFRAEGEGALVCRYDDLLRRHGANWLAREIRLYWARVLKRLDVTSRSLVALIDSGSGFAGSLLEIALACDRSYMLDGRLDDRAPPVITLSEMSFGALKMGNGLSRLESRFLDDPERLAAARAAIGQPLDARAAQRLGLVTASPDDIDWEDEVRLAVEERASFSSDALSGLEANLRFAGPETVETKIFGRLSAWQNWIFQRPNAAGEAGALKLYGTGRRPRFAKTRV